MFIVDTARLDKLKLIVYSQKKTAFFYKGGGE
jgi:hypothetical protein